MWGKKATRINCRGYWEVAYFNRIEINPLDAAISKQRRTEKSKQLDEMDPKIASEAGPHVSP